ncbi:MAG: hypothetical protein HWE33_04240 [Rhodobacteraceae bacterium]|nr:hypothetical protein [Paracoccaceae bacterium]
MALSKPYHRTHRAFIKKPNSGHSSVAYITGDDYSQDPGLYLRSFELIASDLQTLFEYIEPSDEALSTFSFRIHELLVRTCIEIEANFKAILRENKFSKAGNWNISDYRKIDFSHHLSSYKVQLPIWRNGPKIFAPFESWHAFRNIRNHDGKATLTWYQAYNASKHDRHSEFPSSNFENLLNAVSGLAVLLSAQFNTGNLTGGGALVSGPDIPSDFDDAEWGPFRLCYPNDWEENEKYDFNWAELKKEENRYEKFNYDLVWSNPSA